MYQGQWQKNLPHGSGKCRFADGSVYKGDFQNGRMHGVGTLFRHDGAVEFHGHWKDGEKLRPMVRGEMQHADTILASPFDNTMSVANDPQNNNNPIVDDSQPGEMPNESSPPIKLFVTFQGASHLPKMPTAEVVPSPYIVASVGSQTHITKTLTPSFEPRWDREVAEFNVPPLHGRQPLVMRLFSWSPTASKVVGECSVPLRDLTPFAAPREISVPLVRSDDGTKVWGHDAAGAALHLMIQCRSNGNNLSIPASIPTTTPMARLPPDMPAAASPYTSRQPMPPA
eukprot:CAMPEP_0181333104 /NCGR_PEP_ID=MMETSP1101-20121128/25477_1 /TAXON_ID=46948 /ORGANISM="Rhodomonas abbreviata, Strain Caron Lab Isolate" /LENGTH=283 /DNA_ID=CAMNT_0023442849 /DNA_START=36 /DNA_END=883 /DNA_ORIENTATION=+